MPLTARDRRLILRADGDARIGTGHVMRLLALAAAWRELGGETVLLSRMDSAALRERAQKAGVDLIPLARSHPHPDDASALAKLAAEGGAVALDGYLFDPAYQHAVRRHASALLVVDDDVHHERYDADILLNQNVHAPGLAYKTTSDAELLLGPRYALLRPEFRASAAARERPTADIARNVLVTLGGSDPADATSTLVHALGLARIEGLHAKIVVGPSSPHKAAVARAVAQWLPHARADVIENATDMPALMTWADLAICAGGSTAWELSYLGVPALATILAPNQEPIARGLDAAGSMVSLGRASDLDPSAVARVIDRLASRALERARMSQRARLLVDGEGAQRVARALEARLR